MKALALLIACAGTGVAVHHGPCLLTALQRGSCENLDCVPDAKASGTYVEARSVTVFAGACHFNSEVLSQGRQALVGWSFDSGEHDGVPLAGLAVAAAVSSDANLQEGAARRAIVYLDEAADATGRAALLGWLRDHAGDVLGEIVETRVASVAVSRADSAFVLSAGAELAVTGRAMADLSCCTMPENRWYEPLGASAARTVVGVSRECRFAGAGTLPAWTYADANNAFVGSFGDLGPTAGGCCAESSREALSQ